MGKSSPASPPPEARAQRGVQFGKSWKALKGPSTPSKHDSGIGGCRAWAKTTKPRKPRKNPFFFPPAPGSCPPPSSPGGVFPGGPNRRGIKIAGRSPLLGGGRGPGEPPGGQKVRGLFPFPGKRGLKKVFSTLVYNRPGKISPTQTYKKTHLYYINFLHYYKGAWAENPKKKGGD